MLIFNGCRSKAADTTKSEKSQNEVRKEQNLQFCSYTLLSLEIGRLSDHQHQIQTKISSEKLHKFSVIMLHHSDVVYHVASFERHVAKTMAASFYWFLNWICDILNSWYHKKSSQSQCRPILAFALINGFYFYFKTTRKRTTRMSAEQEEGR